MSSKAELLKKYGDASATGNTKKLRRKKPVSNQQNIQVIDEDFDHLKDKAAVDEAWQKDMSDEDVPVIVDSSTIVEVNAPRGSWSSVPQNIPFPLSSRESSLHVGFNDDSPHNSSIDIPSARKTRHDSPDLSPPRRLAPGSSSLTPLSESRCKPVDLNQSPPRRKRHESPDDSPPRRKRHESPDDSPPRRKRHESPDDSPPRRKRHESPDDSPPRRKRHESPDDSPPRRRNDSYPSPTLASKIKFHDVKPRNVEDCSPLEGRMRHDLSNISPPRRTRKPRPRDHCDSPDMLDLGTKNQETSQEHNRTRTSSGYTAGLQSSKEFKKVEAEISKKQKADVSSMQDNSGQHAETVYRDRRGRKLDMLNEFMRQQDADEKRKKDKKEAEYEWGRGKVQKQDEKKLRDDLENIKLAPFARTVEHLDEDLKAVIHSDDPMAKYMHTKLAKKAVTMGLKPSKPIYKGPPPKPNRFGILPGYRWDGIDRGSGWEQKLVEAQGSNQHKKNASYSWSVSDL